MNAFEKITGEKLTGAPLSRKKGIVTLLVGMAAFASVLFFLLVPALTEGAAVSSRVLNALRSPKQRCIAAAVDTRKSELSSLEKNRDDSLKKLRLARKNAFKQAEDSLEKNLASSKASLAASSRSAKSIESSAARRYAGIRARVAYRQSDTGARSAYRQALLSAGSIYRNSLVAAKQSFALGKQGIWDKFKSARIMCSQS